MAIEITGTIHKLFETKQVSAKFTKRELVIQTDEGKYPQMLLVQVTGDKIAQLDGLHEGDTVKCALNLRGREWRSPAGEVKYFNTIEAWRVERTSAAQSVPPPAGTADDCPF